MEISTLFVPELIKAAAETIDQNSTEIIGLDQAIGDGDHLFNLQRGFDALKQQDTLIAELDWPEAYKKIGMILMTTMGGASGSLFGTFFVTMGKAAEGQLDLNRKIFSDIFTQSVEAVKKRGKADAGEKTMLDVLIPVSECMRKAVDADMTLSELLENVRQDAEKGMESTHAMLATKGRASFLQEKSIGHIDAGARTTQLIISAVAVFIDRQ